MTKQLSSAPVSFRFSTLLFNDEFPIENFEILSDHLQIFNHKIPFWTKVAILESRIGYIDYTQKWNKKALDV